MADSKSSIFKLYETAFGRAPDPAGLDYWMGRAAGGMSMGDIANSFLGSQEYSTAPRGTPEQVRSVVAYQAQTPWEKRGMTFDDAIRRIEQGDEQFAQEFYAWKEQEAYNQQPYAQATGGAVGRTPDYTAYSSRIADKPWAYFESPVGLINVEQVLSPMQGKGVNSKTVQAGYPSAGQAANQNLDEIANLARAVGVNVTDEQIARMAQQVIQPGQFDEKGGYADQYTNFLSKVNIPVARALAQQAGKGAEFDAYVNSPQVQQTIAQREVAAKQYGDINSKMSEHTNILPIIGAGVATLVGGMALGGAFGPAGAAMGPAPGAISAGGGLGGALEAATIAPMYGSQMALGAGGAAAAASGNIPMTTEAGAYSLNEYGQLVLEGAPNMGQGAVIGAEFPGTYGAELGGMGGGIGGLGGGGGPLQYGYGDYLGEGLKTGGQGFHTDAVTYGSNQGLGMEGAGGVNLGGYQPAATNSLGFQLTQSAGDVFNAGIGGNLGQYMDPFDMATANRVSYTGAQMAGYDTPLTNLRQGYYGSEMPLTATGKGFNTWVDNAGLANLQPGLGPIQQYQWPGGEPKDMPMGGEPGLSTNALKSLLSLGTALAEAFKPAGAPGGTGQPGYEAVPSPVEYGATQMFEPTAFRKGTGGRGFLEVDIGAPGLQVPGVPRR